MEIMGHLKLVGRVAAEDSVLPGHPVQLIRVTPEELVPILAEDCYGMAPVAVVLRPPERMYQTTVQQPVPVGQVFHRQ